MKTIKNPINNEIIINKSSFITYLTPIKDVTKAKEYINNLKAKYPDATHHVSGYIVGKTGEYAHFTDDGEPSGTAGLPAFEVLKKNDITNVAYDIIRYFGGIKLGAGGLVRAYNKSISDALKLSEIVEIIDYAYYHVDIDYSLLKPFENFFGERIIKRQFSSLVTLTIRVEKDKLPIDLSMIQNLTSNLAKITLLSDAFINELEDEE